MLTLFPFGSNRGKAYCLAVVKSEATFFDADSLNKFIISDYYVRCASWFGINHFFFIRWEIFFIRWESELNWIRNTAQLIRRVTNILVCKIEIIRSIFFQNDIGTLVCYPKSRYIHRIQNEKDAITVQRSRHYPQFRSISFAIIFTNLRMRWYSLCYLLRSWHCGQSIKNWKTCDKATEGRQ